MSAINIVDFSRFSCKGKDSNNPTNQLRYVKGKHSDITNYSYDSRGNLISDKSKNMTIDYNWRNLPERFSFRDDAGELVSFVDMYYDAEGKRTAKAVSFTDPALGDKRVSYVDDLLSYESSNLVEYAQSLNYVNIMTSEGNEGRVYYDYPETGGLISAAQFYIKDHLGSTRLSLNDDMTVGTQYFYDSYGKVEILEKGSEDISVRDKFTGKEYDEDGAVEGVVPGIQLYYFGARYYDADIGSWISTDPVMEYFSGYTYVGNNPINAYDPNGLWTLQLGLGGTGGGGAGGTAGSGFVFGWSKQNGFQFGTYKTGGGGAFGGFGGSLTLDVSVSGNDNINDLQGIAWTNGGSGGEGLVFGGEINAPLNAPSGTQPSLTLSGGIGGGSPAEVHSFVTYTDINESIDNSVSTYSNQAQSGSAPSDATSTRMIIEEQ